MVSRNEHVIQPGLGREEKGSCMLVPVIISGGAGSRLWPVSRETRPKPFMKIQDGLSLLQSSMLRAAAVSDCKAIVVVTNADLYFQSKEQLEAISSGMNRAEISFLLEPVGRNTAAAIAMSAFLVQDRFGPESIMLVLPSDHLIKDQKAFLKLVATATDAARNGSYITFGIIPSSPETGYGYIECLGSYSAGHVCDVKRFVEKPDYDRAKKYFDSGNFLWNSGIFCFRTDVILTDLRKHAREIFDKAHASWTVTMANPANQSNIVRIERNVFPSIPSISIDYAVMEHVGNIKVISSEIGWSDIGSWRSMSELVAPDTNGNRLVGDAVLLETTNTYIQSDGRLIAVVGVDNLVVIDTPDALLVGRGDKMQLVREVVGNLKLNGHEAARWHRTIYRPWGTYTVLEDGPHYKMKRIVVKPRASLSLQMHKHRNEHWVIISGTAEIVNGDKCFTLQRDESTYIPAGNKHRLSNPGDEDLLLIEVQTGDYLGEDDIIRYEDKYGR